MQIIQILFKPSELINDVMKPGKMEKLHAGTCNN